MLFIINDHINHYSYVQYHIEDIIAALTWSSVSNIINKLDIKS